MKKKSKSDLVTIINRDIESGSKIVIEHGNLLVRGVVGANSVIIVKKGSFRGYNVGAKCKIVAHGDIELLDKYRNDLSVDKCTSITSVTGSIAVGNLARKVKLVAKKDIVARSVGINNWISAKKGSVYAVEANRNAKVKAKKDVTLFYAHKDAYIDSEEASIIFRSAFMLDPAKPTCRANLTKIRHASLPGTCGMIPLPQHLLSSSSDIPSDIAPIVSIDKEVIPTGRNSKLIEHKGKALAF